MPYTYTQDGTETNCVRAWNTSMSCKHAHELFRDSQNDEPENSTELQYKSAEKLIQFRNALTTTNKNRKWYRFNYQ
jgi:hypothetical protein